MEIRSQKHLPIANRIAKQQKEKVVLTSEQLNRHLEALDIAENQLSEQSQVIAELNKKVNLLRAEIPVSVSQDILARLKKAYRMGITWQEIKDVFDSYSW